MGVYDTFIAGRTEVQLKNFEPAMVTYRIGDKIPVKENGYPLNCNFFCICEIYQGSKKYHWVVIKKGRFEGIEIRCLPKNNYPIFNCYGDQYKRKDYGGMK